MMREILLLVGGMVSWLTPSLGEDGYAYSHRNQ